MKKFGTVMTTLFVSILTLGILLPVINKNTGGKVEEQFDKWLNLIPEKEPTPVPDTRENLVTIDLRNEVKNGSLTSSPFFEFFKENSSKNIYPETGVPTVASAYRDNGGLKLGTSSKGGSFEIQFNNYTFNRAKVIGRNYSALSTSTGKYSCDIGKFKVNNSVEKEFGTNEEDNTKVAPTGEILFSFNNEYDFLKIESLTSRITIFQIELWKESGKIENPDDPFFIPENLLISTSSLNPAASIIDFSLEGRSEYNGLTNLSLNENFTFAIRNKNQTSANVGKIFYENKSDGIVVPKKVINGWDCYFVDYDSSLGNYTKFRITGLPKEYVNSFDMLKDSLVYKGHSYPSNELSDFFYKEMKPKNLYDSSLASIEGTEGNYVFRYNLNKSFNTGLFNSFPKKIWFVIYKDCGTMTSGLNPIITIGDSSYKLTENAYSAFIGLDEDFFFFPFEVTENTDYIFSIEMPSSTFIDVSKLDLNSQLSLYYGSLIPDDSNYFKSLVRDGNVVKTEEVATFDQADETL